MKFSIVTITYNAESCIERTIRSVLHQTYPNVEYIIVDGCSKDGTIRIVNQYKDSISQFISEPDKGIYDAMNKGIKLATGDYLLFMNADDIFADDEVLQRVAEEINEVADVVYGNWRLVTDSGVFNQKPAPLIALKKKFRISHQATFVKVPLLKQSPFDTRYRYAGDFDMLSSYYLSGKVFQYIDTTIAEVPIESGTTFNHFEESIKEHYQILAKRGMGSPLEMKWLIARKRVVRFLKTNIPAPISKWFFRLLAKYYKVM